jgi:internalin A
LLLAIVLLSLLVLVLPSSSARAETKVDFPDANIRATIGQAINKPTGDIYQSDLADVSSLTAENKDVSDLLGLKYCTSLTSLDLGGNQIGNISSLSSLSDLSELGSLLDQLFNISSPSGLSDLSGLGSLLNQPGNISSPSSLSDLSGLDSLLDQIINISSPSGLSDLSGLGSLLDQIVNISSPSGLSDLSGLGSLLDQPINIPSLSSLSDLSGLNLSRNQISDISPTSTPASAGKKNIWLIVGPIAMVTVIALLVDRFLTLRGMTAPVPPTPTIGQNEVKVED